MPNIKFATGDVKVVKQAPMDDAWFDRLERAIKADGRSLRAISAAAHLSPNFCQQLLKDRKEPGITKLMAILDALGTASTLYVLTGREIMEADEEFFRLVLSLSPALRADALTFFRSLQAHEGERSRQP